MATHQFTTAGAAVSPRVSGAAFIGCPVVLAATAMPLGGRWQLAVGATGVLLLGVGLTGLRQLTTGLGLPFIVAVTAALGVALEVVGTLLQLSGVVLTVPLVLAVGVVLRTSRWRVGDLGFIGLALALGFGLAYVLDNLLYDDNGSQTDQAALAMAGPSLGCIVWAVARTRQIDRLARAAVTLGTALLMLAFVVALETGNDSWIVIAAPAAALLAIGLMATGAGLLQSSRVSTADSPETSTR